MSGIDTMDFVADLLIRGRASWDWISDQWFHMLDVYTFVWMAMLASLSYVDYIKHRRKNS